MFKYLKENGTCPKIKFERAFDRLQEDYIIDADQADSKIRSRPVSRQISVSHSKVDRVLRNIERIYNLITTNKSNDCILKMIVKQTASKKMYNSFEFKVTNRKPFIQPKGFFERHYSINFIFFVYSF